MPACRRLSGRVERELRDVGRSDLLEQRSAGRTAGNHGGLQDVEHLGTTLLAAIRLIAGGKCLRDLVGGLARVALLPCLLGAPDLVLRAGGLEDRTTVVDRHMFSHF